MINKNATLQHTRQFLAGPYTLPALLLYFLNEFLLQPYFPSRLSGILSDFTWLFLAPVIMLLILSIAVPTRSSAQCHRMTWLVYGFTALGFSAVKTLPVIHDAFLSILPFHAAIALDPADLPALFALPLSAWLYLRNTPRSTRISWRAAWALPLFALLTLADAAAPDPGVYSLRLQDDKIFTSGFYTVYSSTDGGLTWQEEPDNVFDVSDQENQQAVSIPGTSRAYRVVEDGSLEHSTDGGSTWQPLSTISPMSDLEAYYYQLTRTGSPSLYRTPPDILYDPASGNVIVARSLAGVYVITPDDQVVEIGVGTNQPAQLYSFESFFALFTTTLLSALILLLLLVNVWFVIDQKWIIRIVLIGLTIGWLILFSLTMSDGYGITIFYMGFTILAILSGILSVFNIISAIRASRTQWGRCFLYALIGSLLFFLPFLLWYANVISTYLLTVILSLGLTAAWIIGGIFYTTREVKQQTPAPPDTRAA